ncbi:hypothetical protein D3C77_270600 [compost metagenome]
MHGEHVDRSAAACFLQPSAAAFLYSAHVYSLPASSGSYVRLNDQEQQREHLLAARCYRGDKQLDLALHPLYAPH